MATVEKVWALKGRVLERRFLCSVCMRWPNANRFWREALGKVDRLTVCQGRVCFIRRSSTTLSMFHQTKLDDLEGGLEYGVDRFLPTGEVVLSRLRVSLLDRCRDLSGML